MQLLLCLFSWLITLFIGLEARKQKCHFGNGPSENYEKILRELPFDLEEGGGEGLAGKLPFNLKLK